MWANTLKVTVAMNCQKSTEALYLTVSGVCSKRVPRELVFFFSIPLFIMLLLVTREFAGLWYPGQGLFPALLYLYFLFFYYSDNCSNVLFYQEQAESWCSTNLLIRKPFGDASHRNHSNCFIHASWTAIRDPSLSRRCLVTTAIYAK